MDIKPETVKKLAYPALAAVAAAALSACDPETPTEDIDQGIPGEPPAVYPETPPEDIDQGIRGEPPAVYRGRIQSEE